MASNLPVVNVEQFTQIVELHINEGNKRPVFGLGKGGIGKTESICNLAQKLKIGYVDIRLLMYSEVDLKGIPFPDEHHIHTIWLQNNILPNVERDGERGILVLDEITSVARSVRTAAYQLLNERRLGEYVLPENWTIVCLGNGEEDGGDYQGMEGNFANRCSMLYVVPEVEAWKHWAYEHGVNYLVLGYVSWRPSELHTYKPDNETDMLFASPRSWKAVSDILNSHQYNKDDLLTNIRILSNVGSSVGNQFTSFCKYKESAIDPADILAGKYAGDTSTSLEVLFMTLQGVIKLMSDSIKTDVINHGGIMANTLNKCSNGIKWMLSLKSLEHRVMGLKDFISTNRQVIVQMFLSPAFSEVCPELLQFTETNKSIFTK